jgi:hypothetical protein
VNDVEAVYPVRIDPTFCDANWVSMGGFAGAAGVNSQVSAAVIDSSGNLYIGGGSQLSPSATPDVSQNKIVPFVPVFRTGQAKHKPGAHRQNKKTKNEDSNRIDK